MNIGRVKVVFDRTRQYAQSLNTLMILYLFIDKTGWYWWYLSIIPVIFLLIYYDTKKVIAEERDYIWTRPGKLNDLINNVEDIKRKIGG